MKQVVEFRCLKEGRSAHKVSVVVSHVIAVEAHGDAHADIHFAGRTGVTVAAPYDQVIKAIAGALANDG